MRSCLRHLLAPCCFPALLCLAVTTFASDPMDCDPAKNIQRHASGALETGFTMRAETVNGLPLPADAWVCFHNDGTFDWIYLPVEHELNGLRFAAKEYLRFDDAGHLVEGVPATAFEFGGYRFAAGKRLQFHPARPGAKLRVTAGTLAAERTVDGFALAADEIELSEKGALRAGVSAKPQEHHGIPVGTGDRVTFHANGRIASVTNDWGVGFWDDQGHHTGHKQYARDR